VISEFSINLQVWDYHSFGNHSCKGITSETEHIEGNNIYIDFRVSSDPLSDFLVSRKQSQLETIFPFSRKLKIPYLIITH
jgi:hypothetical protein